MTCSVDTGWVSIMRKSFRTDDSPKRTSTPLKVEDGTVRTIDSIHQDIYLLVYFVNMITVLNRNSTLNFCPISLITRENISRAIILSPCRNIILAQLHSSKFSKRNYSFPLHSQKVVTYFGQIIPNFAFLFIRGVRTGRTGQ